MGHARRKGALKSQAPWFLQRARTLNAKGPLPGHAIAAVGALLEQSVGHARRKGALKSQAPWFSSGLVLAARTLLTRQGLIPGSHTVGEGGARGVRTRAVSTPRCAWHRACVATRATAGRCGPFECYKETPSFPSDITREYPPSLLILQGNTLLPF